MNLPKSTAIHISQTSHTNEYSLSDPQSCSLTDCPVRCPPHPLSYLLSPWLFMPLLYSEHVHCFLQIVLTIEFFSHCRAGAMYFLSPVGGQLLPGPDTVLGPLLHPQVTPHNQMSISILVLQRPDIIGVYRFLTEFLPLHRSLHSFWCQPSTSLGRPLMLLGRLSALFRYVSFHLAKPPFSPGCILFPLLTPLNWQVPMLKCLPDRPTGAPSYLAASFSHSVVV